MTRDSGHLASLLLEEGLLTQELLEKGLAMAAETGRPLGRVLVEEKIVSERDLVRTLAKAIGVEFVDLKEITIDPAATALIPDALARRYAAIPIGFEDNKLVVALSDPANVLAIDDIRAISGRDVIAKVATRSDVENAIANNAGLDESVTDFAGFGDDEMETQDLNAVEASTEEAPIVKLVNMLIAKASAERASDLHIEPTDKDLRVRFRVDGVLHEIMRTPRSVSNAVVSRLKIMADMDIAERRRPQDGRISLRVGGTKTIDLRVSSLPTIYGEKIVMRILDNSTATLELEGLGFEPDTLERYASSYNKAYGTILCCGPTGSGKSTTLYSTLNVLNQPDVNIVTIEDPVEYRLAGINQVQVNKKAGLTFASALRSFLRQDPDIMLVGEIRDQETGEIAIESALTGHLVLSTMHTNDAPAAISRLIEMGVEPFLVGSAVDSVLGQRLARRLCVECKTPYQPTKEALARVGWQFDELGDDVPELFKPGGCARCGNTGYRGRLALHELMLVSEEIERLAVDQATTDSIKKVAVEQGMRPLRQDGLLKARRGDTSIEEILRVTV